MIYRASEVERLTAMVLARQRAGEGRLTTRQIVRLALENAESFAPAPLIDGSGDCENKEHLKNSLAG